MVVVGFGFNNIEVKKDTSFKGKVDIKSKVDIADVQASDLFLGKNKQQGLKFMFNHSIMYEPKFGHIKLSGEVLYIEEEKKIKEILDKWKKEKKVSGDVMTMLLNNILTKCNIEALLLSREVGLPSPIPLPRFNINAKK